MKGRRASGMDRDLGLDKSGPPNTMRILEAPELPHSRKNFSVSHLLDLEEAAAAGMQGSRDLRPPNEEEDKDPMTGGSSDSEVTVQEGKSPHTGKIMGHLGCTHEMLPRDGEGSAFLKGCVNLMSG